MSDIVQRLRRKTVAGQPVFPTPLDIEAADEIERLRAWQRTAIDMLTLAYGAACAEHDAACLTCQAHDLIGGAQS